MISCEKCGVVIRPLGTEKICALCWRFPSIRKRKVSCEVCGETTIVSQSEKRKGIRDRCKACRRPNRRILEYMGVMLTINEIAGSLGVTVGTIYTRLREGRPIFTDKERCRAAHKENP